MPGFRFQFRQRYDWRFPEIYYASKDPGREIDLYWWFEAMWQARLTQHDRFIVWQFQNAKQARLLLTIKVGSECSGPRL
jgi:hypothetical protein